MASIIESEATAIHYSYYTKITKEQQRFVKFNTVTFILSGSLIIYTDSGCYNFQSGDVFIAKKNQLVRAIATPVSAREFKSITISFHPDSLRDFVLENKLQPVPPYSGESVLPLMPNPLYESYTSSLAAYQQGAANDALTKLKVKEALMLIMLLDKASEGMLFDSTKPCKVDLEEYMNLHYALNVSMDVFAYLTGRSLATFKRDFTKHFNTTPNKWLQQRRLKEAYYLIKEKRRKVSEVYLEVGFEDLSHFSFTFKNAFGKSPSRI